MTFQHRAGVSPYTSPFGFAETCVFDKQSLGPLLCDRLLHRFPLSLSYGVILPSSLTTLLPSSCGFSPRLPVSVCGTGTYIAIAAFLDSVDSFDFATKFRSASRFRIKTGICLRSFPLRLPRFSLSRVRLSSCVPTVLYIRSTGISTCCPSATAFALALGPDLP